MADGLFMTCDLRRPRRCAERLPDSRGAGAGPRPVCPSRVRGVPRRRVRKASQASSVISAQRSARRQCLVCSFSYINQPFSAPQPD
ncbi:hypothetical protein CCHR01_08857 [Colletotrichum chrysophilum]|uniref:Uncharacterized protein n=1 Tax=Colletotrichum chrysophilum TaxID=1836956 RepID=A0AAD9AHR1_9PEZI|nr:hypothetical protein CCHR01_08857 [Colletotrichum chrysophilum]